MADKTLLFHWSRGADVRRLITRLIAQEQRQDKPIFLNALAGQLGLSHVAVKKHLDLLVEEGYVEGINPDGKPVFLRLTKNGQRIHSEIRP